MAKILLQNCSYLKRLLILCICIVLCNYFVVPLIIIPYLFMPVDIDSTANKWILAEQNPWKRSDYSETPHIPSGNMKVHFSGIADLQDGQADIAVCYYMGRYYDRYLFQTNWEKRITLLEFKYQSPRIKPALLILDSPADKSYKCPLTKQQVSFIAIAQAPGDFTYIVINRTLIAYKQRKIFYFHIS